MLSSSFLRNLAFGLAVAGASAAAAAPASAQSAAAPSAPPAPTLVAAPSQPDLEKDHEAIRQVVAAFKDAIKFKNLPALRSVFYNGDIRWLSSGHPPSRAFAERLSGEPVPVVDTRGAHEMLDDPRMKALAFEERFYAPKIVTDGQIATVTFDYDFRVNGQVQNWGAETWQMVKTEDGWRILQLLFSYHLPQVTRPPERMP